MDFPDPKILMTGFAIVIALFTYLPYCWLTFKGKIRPHLFSWVLWGMLTSIAFFAQLSDGAGAGAYITGFTSIMCLAIAALSFWRGEKNITRSDAIAFIAGLSAIPVWVVTNNPLWSVIMVAAIDALGFYPTFRKSWIKPHEEMALVYFLSGFKFAVSLFALEHITLITAFYPCSVILTNWSFLALLLLRRRAVLKGA